MADKGIDSVSGSRGLASYDEDGHLSWRDI